MRRWLWLALWSVGDWCTRQSFKLYDLDEVTQGQWRPHRPARYSHKRKPKAGR